MDNLSVFFELVRSGLWEDSVHFTDYEYTENLDWDEIYRLASEQSVVGVVLAGIEHSRVKPPQELLLQWIGEVQIQEQQNKEMNQFIAKLIEKLRKVDIYTLLLKGQGVAQCYEKPLWRTSGDVDLFLSDSNYEKAKKFLIPLASSTEKEVDYDKHLGMTIDQWVVELHGSIRSGLSSGVDKVLDNIQHDIFCGGNVRSWVNGKTQIFLPDSGCDAVYVFTHILQHFYKGGIGLRQVCDWCRLLWTFKDKLNHDLLESRIRKAGLMSEWKTFEAFAVEYLGMPKDAMPFYSDSPKWSRKANRICSFIMEVGNFGHNRDTSYFERHPYMVRKIISLGRRCGDLWRHAKIFPWDSLRFFPCIMFQGLRSAARGE